MVPKFNVLERPILSSPNKTDKIVKAICILHNFIRKMDGKISEPMFQSDEVHNNNTAEQHNFRPQSQRATDEAIMLRDRLHLC